MDQQQRCTLPAAQRVYGANRPLDIARHKTFEHQTDPKAFMCVCVVFICDPILRNRSH